MSSVGQSSLNLGLSKTIASIDREWRTGLLERVDYLAGPDFEKNYSWQKHSNDIWSEVMSTENPEEPFPFTVVGRVYGGNLFMEPIGNYTTRFKKHLESSKFQFTIVRPDDSPEFAADFDIAMQRIKEIQKKGSRHTEHIHFIIDVNGHEALRFSKEMFGLRDEPLSEYNSSDQTINWPVGSQYAEAFKSTARLYEIQIPRVYDQQSHRVEPAGIQALMMSALVEVTFTLKRCEIGDVSKGHDTDIGVFQQVRIIRREKSKNRSLFDRTEDEGPLIPKKLKPKRNDAHGPPDATGNDETATQPVLDNVQERVDISPSSSLSSLSSGEADREAAGQAIEQTEKTRSTGQGKRTGKRASGKRKMQIDATGENTTETEDPPKKKLREDSIN